MARKVVKGFVARLEVFFFDWYIQRASWWNDVKLCLADAAEVQWPTWSIVRTSRGGRTDVAVAVDRAGKRRSSWFRLIQHTHIDTYSNPHGFTLLHDDRSIEHLLHTITWVSKRRILSYYLAVNGIFLLFFTRIKHIWLWDIKVNLFVRVCR